MKKTILAISLAVLLVLSVPLSAFAAGGLVKWNTEYLSLDVVQIHTSNSWVTPAYYNFTTEDGTNRGHLTAGGSASMGRWRARFYPTSSFPTYEVTERFLQLDVTLNYWNMISSSAFTQNITGALYVYAPDSKIYEFPITEQMPVYDGTAIESYLLTIGGVADVGIGFDLKDCYFEFMCSGATTTTSIDLYFNNIDFAYRSKYTDDTVQIVESVEKGFADLENKIEQSTQDIIDNQNQNTQDIIDNNNANADKITGSIEDSTDEILNNDLGYETPDEVSDNLNVIQTLTSQVDVINAKVNDAKQSINDGAEHFCKGAEDFGDFINQFFAKLPTAFTFLVFGLIIFLVVRKAVGR